MQRLEGLYDFTKLTPNLLTERQRPSTVLRLSYNTFSVKRPGNSPIKGVGNATRSRILTIKNGERDYYMIKRAKSYKGKWVGR